MFQTIKTLFDSANARAEERVRETYSIELIDQKIREATRTLRGPAALSEAEALIRDVLSADDPFEQAQILQDIDAGLTGQGVADRLVEEGFGTSKKTTGADVLSRLKSDK